MTSSTDLPLASASRRRLLGLAALLPLAPLSRPATASTSDAQTFISELGDVVLVILSDASLDNNQKLERLKTLLNEHTDLDLVARLVLGRHWRTATDAERAEYIELFRQILMNTLAARLGDYNGQTFEVLGSTGLNERDTAVQTQIIRVGGAPPLQVDWRVRESDGGYAIIDVVAEGVSLVVSQRNEVGSIVERDGMPGLIEAMRERSGEGETVL
jgi:phospholipid transport system substrate-binding protein